MTSFQEEQNLVLTFITNYAEYLKSKPNILVIKGGVIKTVGLKYKKYELSFYSTDNKLFEIIIKNIDKYAKNFKIIFVIDYENFKVDNELVSITYIDDNISFKHENQFMKRYYDTSEYLLCIEQLKTTFFNINQFTCNTELKEKINKLFN